MRHTGQHRKRRPCDDARRALAHQPTPQKTARGAGARVPPTLSGDPLMPLRLVVRSSTRRWTQLSALLRAFERCVEASARLDGARRTREYSGTRRDARTIASLDGRLLTLERHIDREFDRLTVERLLQDLAQKQQRCSSDSGGAKGAA